MVNYRPFTDAEHWDAQRGKPRAVHLAIAEHLWTTLAIFTLSDLAGIPDYAIEVTTPDLSPYAHVKAALKASLRALAPDQELANRVFDLMYDNMESVAYNLKWAEQERADEHQQDREDALCELFIDHFGNYTEAGQSDATPSAAQAATLAGICQAAGVAFDPASFTGQYWLPGAEWVGGWVGDPTAATAALYAVSPDGTQTFHVTNTPAPTTAGSQA